MKISMSNSEMNLTEAASINVDISNLEPYWVWLHELKGVTNMRKKELLTQYKSPREIFNLPHHILGDTRVTEAPTSRKVRNVRIKQLVRAEKIIRDSSAMNVHLLTVHDYRYRTCVKNNRHSPILFYYRGYLEEPIRPIVTIILPHIPTLEEKQLTHDICRIYHERGYIIALGISLHSGPRILQHILQDSGPVYAFCTGGLDCCYPVDHWATVSQILQQGAMISMNTLGTLPKAHRTTMRNRMLALWADEMVLIGSNLTTSSSTCINYAIERKIPLYQWESYHHENSQLSCVANTHIPLVKRIAPKKTGNTSSLSINSSYPHNSREAHYCETLYDLLWNMPLSKREIADALNLPESTVIQLLSNMERCGSIESRLPERWQCKIHFP